MVQRLLEAGILVALWVTSTTMTALNYYALAPLCLDPALSFPYSNINGELLDDRALDSVNNLCADGQLNLGISFLIAFASKLMLLDLLHSISPSWVHSAILRDSCTDRRSFHSNNTASLPPCLTKTCTVL